MDLATRDGSHGDRHGLHRRVGAGTGHRLWGAISGRLVDESGLPVRGALVTLDGASETVRSDESGRIELPRLSPGTYELRAQAPGYAPRAVDVVARPGGTSEVEVALTGVFMLDDSVSTGVLPSSTATAPDVLHGLVLAGISNTIIRLQGLAANLAEKSPRQVFARVPGVFAYDMDGSGNQVNISTRGLDPHRSWELNVRQHGSSSTRISTGTRRATTARPWRPSSRSRSYGARPRSSTGRSTGDW